LKRVVPSRLRSALRFSQPLSGFLANPNFVALFRATALPEVPPFRAFPCRRSRTPLGATCSLVVIHQPRRTNLPRPYQRWFPLTPTPKRGSQIPPTPMGSLSSHQKGTSPGPPGLERPNRPLRPAASTSKLFSLRQSVPPVQVSLKLKAEALLGFLPFGAFPAHALDPQPNLPRRQLPTSPEDAVRT
jgi:hypothetical protein